MSFVFDLIIAYCIISIVIGFIVGTYQGLK